MSATCAKIPIPENLLEDIKALNIPNEAAIEVYYLEAILGVLPGAKIPKDSTSHSTDLNVLTPNAYHTGVGFRVITSSGLEREFVFDLTAKDFGKYVFLPDIDYANKKLQWCNNAFFNFEPVIDRKYWIKSTIICTITPSDLDALIKWLLTEYIPKNSTYILLSVISEISRESIFNPIKHSYLCDDFCYDVFRYFQNVRNITINYYTVPSYNIAAIVVGKDVKITEMYECDPKIFEFFSQIDTIFKDLMEYSAARALAVKTAAEAKANPTPANIAAAKAATETVRVALQKLFEVLKNLTYTKAHEIMEEIISDLIDIGNDVMIILEKIKISPEDPFAKAVIDAYNAFMKDKTTDNFFNLLKALYILAGSQKENLPPATVSDLEAKLNDLYHIIPKIMASLKTIIYYGYKDDRTMGYFLIESTNMSLYVNYLDTDLMRDQDFLDIYGNKVTDIYSRTDYDKKIIHNYNCEKREKNFLYIMLAVLLIIYILMIIMKCK
jgi:hypothetical protein